MKSRKKDKDTLSPRAAEIRKHVELAKNISDVRQEKVEIIKKQIEAGTYDVSAESVAGSLIDLHRSLKLDNSQIDRKQK